MFERFLLVSSMYNRVVLVIQNFNGGSFCYIETIRGLKRSCLKKQKKES